MKKFAGKILLCLLVLALALPAGSCANRPRPVKVNGKTAFRLGFSGTPDTLNPYAAADDEAAAALALVYDTLFSVDIETGEYAGSLCQEWTVKDGAAQGGRLWSVTLRPEVLWHDGQALTASDVEFSLQSMKDFSARFSVPDSEFLDVTGIAVEDDTHLSFIAWGADEPVLECLSHIPIVPRHVWNDVAGLGYDSSGIPRNYALGRETLCGVEPSENTMVGSGLYVWGGYENGVCTLVRNDGYWGESAAAELVELRYGCGDPAQALLRREIDACWDMPGSSYEALGREGGYALAAGTAGELYFLSVNLDPDAARGALRSAEVRQAMDYCLDRAGILNRAFGGGVPSQGFLTPYSPWYYETALTAPRNYSPASARWLLENTGYTDADADGVREAPGGERLSFELLCSDASAAWGRAAEEIRLSLAEAGIEITVRTLPPEEAARAAAAGDYELLLTAVQCYNDPFYTLGLFAWNGGDNAFSAPGLHGSALSPGWNFSGWRSEEYDALYEQMLSAAGETRQGLVTRLGEMLYSQAAALPIGFKAGYQACSAAWMGARPYRGQGLYFTPETLLSQLRGLSAGGKR